MSSEQDYKLSLNEIKALAEGEAPASMGIIDYEDLIVYLAQRVVEVHDELQTTIDHYVGDGFDDI